MEDRAAALVRTIRITKRGFIAFGVLLIYVMVRSPAPPQASPNPTFELAITFVALANVAIGFLAPRLFGFARKRTTQSQSRSDAIGQWMQVSLVSLACFNACTLFGFVLHFVGSRILFVEITFAAGLISLLVWRPQATPTTEDGKRAQD
jgi:hypothetical protein